MRILRSAKHLVHEAYPVLKVIVGLMLASAAAAQAAETYIIETIGGAAGAADDGPASAARLLQPEGIAIDGAGNVYVSDAGDNRVRKISPNGMIATVAGTGAAGFAGDGGPAIAAQLNHPYGIALDVSGNLFIADLGNSRIRKVDGSGVITSVVGGGPTPPYAGRPVRGADARLLSPRNIAFDPVGNMYVSDFDAHLVYKVDRAGMLTVFAGDGKGGFAGDNGPAIAAALSYPAGLAADAAGSVYIGDSGNDRIRRVWYGTISTFAGKVPSPTGIALDAAGRLYAASSTAEAGASPSAALRIVAAQDVASDPGGVLYLATKNSVERVIGSSVATIAGGSDPPVNTATAAALDAHLGSPVALARSSSGDIYIAEQTGNRVRKITGNGLISTVLDETQVKAPSGAAVDASGSVYVSDTGGNRILKIGPTGALSTVAAMLSAPTCLRAGSDGSLYVCDTGNDRILRITPAGIQSLAASIAKPAGLAIASDGALYVSSGAQIVKFAASGEANTILDQLANPAGLALDNTGALLVAEAGRNRILKVAATSNIAVVAGTGLAGFSGDGGPAAAAQLNAPLDLVLDASGDIYIADAVNNRIRKLAPAPAAGALTPPPISAPVPAQVAIVNAASLLPGPVAPDEIVAIYGAGFNPSDTQVTFDGARAKIFYASANQVNALVPAGVQLHETTVVNVLAKGTVVGAATVNTTAANPALFTAGSGVGQAAALNQDASYNSDESPAARGTIVSLFLTGDGQSAGTAYVSIAGYDCDVLYAGAAPGYPGLTQINIRVPGGFMPPGDQPVLVSINGASTQAGVTLAVR